MPPATWLRFAPRAGVLALLGAVVLLMAWLVSAAFAPEPPHPLTGGGTSGASDLSTYLAIVEAMRGGADYYEAAQAELRKHYGTRSIFNWRTPLNSWWLAALPSLDWAMAIGVALAGMTVLFTYRLVRESAGPVFAGFSALLLLVALADFGTPDAILFAEINAGLLILISVIAYGSRLPWLGLAAGALALFLRELSAPYVVICVILALRERRWTEVWAWAAVLAAYAGYFGWHASEAMARVGPEDRAYADSWLAFGGTHFVLASGAFNGLVRLLPVWVTTAILPLGLLGLAVRPQAARALLTALAYVALFTVAGKPTNAYWGALYTALLMLGLPWAVPALRDAWGAVRSPRWSSGGREGALRSGSSPRSAGGNVR